MDFHPINFIIFLLFLFLMYLTYKIIRREKVEDNKKELVLLDTDAFLNIAKKYMLGFKISCADWNEGIVEKVTIVDGKLIEEEYSYYDDNIGDIFFEKL